MDLKRMIVGAQWGDEGKGKLTDQLAEEAEVILRVHGGTNAGHSVVVDGKRYAIHQLTSGIIRAGKLNLAGPYVVYDLEKLVEELKMAARFGSDVFIDGQGLIVLPIHKQIDQGREIAAAKGRIGTTGKGIGPSYEDFWGRRGVTLNDLRSRATIRKALTQSYYDEKLAIAKFLGQNPMDRETLVEWLYSFSEFVMPYVADTREILLTKLNSRYNRLLIEGAHGILLDPIVGMKPYVTSSMCSPACVAACYGIYNIDEVIGVVKAYTTRVGEGPFPTEIFDEVGERIRKVGHEFGTTTGRPRRCGWLDLFALGYAMQAAAINRYAITKLDVLSGLDEIRICTGYKLDDEFVSPFASFTTELLESVTPVYKTLPGWKEDLIGCRSIEELPINARNYIAFVDKLAPAKLIAVGVGPDREHVINL